MKTCLVTGGAGFIGSHIVEALVDRGVNVRVVDDLSSGSLDNLAKVLDRVEFIEGDVADMQLMKDAVAGVDCVFHHAAMVSVPVSVEDPFAAHHACATGTLTVLEAARKAGVRRVVYAGSSAAYGDSTEGAKHEQAILAPMSPYGAAKLAGECYCLAYWASYKLETVTLRYFNVYGPRQPLGDAAAVIPAFISAILSGKRPVIFGDGLQSRDFVYVADVVRANLLAAEKPGVAGKIFNVGTGRSVTLLQLLETLNKVLDTNVSPEFGPGRPGDVRHSLADISNARRHLGYEPQVDLETGLRLSVDYYRRALGL